MRSAAGADPQRAMPKRPRRIKLNLMGVGGLRTYISFVRIGDQPSRWLRWLFQKELSMSKFAIGDKVDNAADDHEGGTVVAVFPTVEGDFRYAVDTEGYGALQFFAEEKLIVHHWPDRLIAADLLR
jgi:hypothetical protein